MGLPELTPPSRGQNRLALLVLLVLVLLVSARTIASFVIEFQWWQEMGQLSTWISMLLYRSTPALAASLIAFAVLLLTHSRALSFAGVTRVGNKFYSRLAPVVLLAIGFFVGSSSVDTWTVVRFFGGRNLPAEATA